MLDRGWKFYWRRALVTVLAIAVGAVRPWLVTHEVNKHLSQSFQAVAHGLVAGLIVAAWWGGRRWDGFWWAVGLTGILTAIEVASTVAAVAL